MVPQSSWVVKKFIGEFLGKISGDFSTPPSAPPEPPGRGGSARTPGTPPWGGPPRKRGRPSPRAFLAKNVQKRGSNMPKMGFFGHFWGIFGRNLHFFDKFWKVSGELCREKNGLQASLSAGEKPANLYSTKCRIFGPPPPPGGYQCTECTSRGSRGPSPLGPAQARSPPFAPRAPLNMLPLQMKLY
jgi:hypothetical protein